MHGYLEQVGSRVKRKTLALGSPLVIETLWERLGLKKTLENITTAAGAQILHERALLAMVANRLCDPESKLGVWDRWLSKVYLPTCSGMKLRHMYEAMDLLHAHAEQVEKTVFFQTADLFNLEVDLIFYDTTTASFSVDGEDGLDGPANATLRKFGHSCRHTLNRVHFAIPRLACVCANSFTYTPQTQV